MYGLRSFFSSDESPEHPSQSIDATKKKPKPPAVNTDSTSADLKVDGNGFITNPEREKFDGMNKEQQDSAYEQMSPKVRAKKGSQILSQEDFLSYWSNAVAHTSWEDVQKATQQLLIQKRPGTAPKDSGKEEVSPAALKEEINEFRKSKLAEVFSAMDFDHSGERYKCKGGAV